MGFKLLLSYVTVYMIKIMSCLYIDCVFAKIPTFEPYYEHDQCLKSKIY